ncbi:MAG: ABC transporter permease subunit [Gammaproteobacteria bacterium]|nr:ABC transporter permease subunit [Gammaproteobacteria bacterium]
MMQSLPGDAAFRIAAGRYGYDIMDATAAASVRAELGLDRSLPLQFWSWMTQLANGDLGRSLVTGNPVWEELAPQLAASMALAGVAIIFSLVIAVPIGTVAGLWPGGIFDQATLLLSAGLRSVPAFALGVVLMLALAVEARVLPVAGYGEARHFVLPSLALGLSLASVSNRVIRDAVVACSGSAWYAFARTKGLSRPDVLVRHVARNAAVPTLAYVGVQLALLIEGVVIIESVFAWPGIGHALVHAIFERDLPMVQGTALVLGLTFVILSFTVDLACRALDPRGSPAA